MTIWIMISNINYVYCATILNTYFITTGNELRDDFQFFHTFDKDTISYYNMKAGDIVVFNSERFYTKHEPKFYRLDKVSQPLPFVKSVFNAID